jgi:hypothetical protein
MANQNLSQFTEKTFVADADWVFLWDTAGAISKKVSRNTLLNSGTLATSAPVTISQTWNDAAVAFTALKVNATSTSAANSASGSLLLDLQVGGASVFKVSKTGEVTSNFISTFGVNALNLQYGATGVINAFTNFNLGVGNSLVFSDVFLQRDGAANTLALRNSTAAQTFNVYGTWTTAITNFERLAIKYNGSDLAYQIAAEKGSTNGDYRPLQLWTGGASRLAITAAGNVGIGTTAPAATLHVNGLDADQNTKRIALFQSNDLNIQNDFSVVGITSADTIVNTFQHRLLDLEFTNVAGTVTASTYVRMLTNGTERAGIGLADNEFVITGAATERLRISAAGNVGIGTTAPAAKLDVVGGIQFNSIAIARSGSIGTLPNNTTGLYFGYDSSGDRSFITSGTTNASGVVSVRKPAIFDYSTFTFTRDGINSDLFINSSGNVGIGTTAPSSKLQVTGGDVEIETVTSGIIMKAAGTSTRYRITLNATGDALVFTAV